MCKKKRKVYYSLCYVRTGVYSFFACSLRSSIPREAFLCLAIALHGAVESMIYDFKDSELIRRGPGSLSVEGLGCFRMDAGLQMDSEFLDCGAGAGDSGSIRS